MVLNKVDLTPVASGVRTDAYGRIAGLALSAQTGAGVQELRQLLMDRARGGQASAQTPGHDAGLEAGQEADDRAGIRSEVAAGARAADQEVELEQTPDHAPTAVAEQAAEAVPAGDRHRRVG